MRYFVIGTFICACLLVLTAGAFGQGSGCVTSGADAGTRNGIYYTDCFPRLSGETDDTNRIRRAINSPDVYGTAAADTGWDIETGNPVRGYRKVIFNEKSYTVSDEIRLAQFLILEGTSLNTTTGGPTTFITQTTNAKAVFLIKPGLIDPEEEEASQILEEIAIRDIGFKGNGSLNSAGIRAEGDMDDHWPALFFQFSNLRFSNFHRAISVSPADQGWQMDSVRLDRCTFEGNVIGVHVNSANSGWTISSINMKVPKPATSGAWSGLDTMGFFFESSTYTSVNMATGNGPAPLSGSDRATVFIKIVRHGNISIQNAVSEGFVLDLIVDGVNSSTQNFPIALINNHFMHGVTIKDSTVMSTGNQFGYADSSVSSVAKADVTGNSQIFSMGDKFCFEGQSPCTLGGVDYSKYRAVVSTAKITAINKDNLSFELGYTPMTIKDGVLNFNGNATITVGTLVFANINLGVLDNGTLYYCHDCQQTNPCSGSGSGAFAKRINGAWVCN